MTTFRIWLDCCDATLAIWEFSSVSLLAVRWVVSWWPERAELETFGGFTRTE